MCCNISLLIVLISFLISEDNTESYETVQKASSAQRVTYIRIGVGGGVLAILLCVLYCYMKNADNEVDKEIDKNEAENPLLNNKDGDGK